MTEPDTPAATDPVEDPTDEGTAAPTDPTEKPTDPTDAPEMPTEAPTDEPKPGKKGCGSVIGLSALVAVVSAGWMLRKKREE